MYVRVYDKQKMKHYKSMVYGIVNVGFYEQAIIVNPYSECFELVEYLDKDTKECIPLYQRINSNCDEWITYEKTFLLKLKKYCKDYGYDIDLSRFRGYKDVYDNFSFMLNIIRNKSVLISATNIRLRNNEDIEQWNYIRTQDDANEFMRIFAGFHDSTLDNLNYEEEYGKTKLTVCFDNTGWYGVVELCFEGLIAFNLRPPLENYSASFIISDECVFWADDELENEDLCYSGTFIKALNVKWRKID